MHQLLANRVYANHKLFLLNLLVISFVIGMVLTFGSIYPPSVQDVTILLPALIPFVSPKPLEQLIFQLCVIVVPLNSLIYIINTKVKRQKLNIFWTYCIPLGIGLALFSCLLDFEWTNYFFNGFNVETANMPIMFFIFIVFSLICSFFLIKAKVQSPRYSSYYNLFNWGFFILVSFLTLLAWRIYSIEMVNQDWRFVVHLDALLYPLTQVVKGKVILADLSAQYGLFPEIVAPFFKLIGLSVLKFSLFMAVLQIVALMALFYVITKAIRSGLIVFLIGSALIIITFGNLVYFSGLPDAYYQYAPIRVFWPALSIFMFFKFCQNKSVLKSGLISFISAIAIIWNLDTGFFIFIGYALYLALRYFLLKIAAKDTRKKDLNWGDTDFLYALILHVVVFVLTIGGFFLILSLSSIHELNYELLYKYQKVFYGLGFNMIAMPKTPYPWMIVISIYIYGLMGSLYTLKAKPNLKSELLLYLSILGTGLFVYYEGRSCAQTLFAAMWPSVIISGIFAESQIRMIRLKLISRANLIFPVMIFSICLICSVLLIINIPKYYIAMMANLANRNTYSSSLTQSELNFIKANTTPGSECFLLVKNEAAYYAEADISSPIRGPGLSEILLVEDINQIEQQIELLQPSCVMLGNGPSAYNLRFDYNRIFKNYVIVSSNQEKSLLLLRPKK